VHKQNDYSTLLTHSVLKTCLAMITREEEEDINYLIGKCIIAKSE
jgi:hypothetical protein